MQQPLTAVFCLTWFLTANSALVRQFHELYYIGGDTCGQQKAGQVVY